MRKSLLTIILALAGFLLANAQYTFTISGGFSGNCANVSGYRELNQQLLQIKGQAVGGFPDRASCEQMRAVINSIKTQAIMIIYDARTGRVIDKKNYNCSFSLSASPCTGRPFGGSAGEPNILGVGQGSSFSSTNSTYEIQDWSSDDMERMLALNPEFVNYSSSDLSTGDIEADMVRNNARETAFVIDPSKPFRSLNVGEDGQINTRSDDFITPKERPAEMSVVKSYIDRINMADIPDFSSGDMYIQWIYQKYKDFSGYDIEALSRKYGLTDTEKQVLANFREFYKATANGIVDKLKDNINSSNETKVFEMSVLSDDSYGQSEFLGMTNYEKMYSADLSDYDPMKSTLNIIERFDKETGFHAELYYNKALNEYTIAFEGSNMNPVHLRDFVNDWWNTNKKQGFGDIPDQYKMAAYIASNLPDGVKVNFTGHSLGGGLASLCGAITGKPTFTFNAEGVNENILGAFGIDTNRNNLFGNIKAYHTSNDLLSYVQDNTGNIIAAPALGERINTGKLQSTGQQIFYDLAGTAIVSAVSTVSPLGTVIGAVPNVGSKAMAHKLAPMVTYFQNERNSMAERIHQSISLIRAEESRSAMRTLDAIQVTLE